GGAGRSKGRSASDGAVNGRPFDELLDALEKERHPERVNAEERLAFYGLVHCYDGFSSREFADAVVALLARSQEEAQAIRDAFEALYLPRARERVTEQRTKQQRQVWKVLLAILALGAFALIVTLRFSPSTPDIDSPQPD